VLLLEWNGGVSNLISRNDVPRLVERHFTESVEPAHWLKASGAKRWLDLGSGGGLPAIPLVILGVGEQWTLVESRRNKTLFLQKAAQVLKLPNLEVVRDRIENLPDPNEDLLFDGFTSRATMPLEVTLEQAGRFVRPGGSAFLWKGSRRENEMAADEGWREVWELDGLLGVGSAGTVVARFIRK
jgi:16S rRNA (guanine527-N7)-methyltransferase